MPNTPALGITIPLPTPRQTGNARPHKLGFRVFTDERDVIEEAARAAGYKDTGKFLRDLGMSAARALLNKRSV